MDKKENEYISTLWILKKDSEEMYRLTNSGKDLTYIWLNEEEILFTSGRDMGVNEREGEGEEKKTRFFKINIHGGEAEHLFTVDEKVSGLKRSKSCIFAVVWEGLEEDEEQKEGGDEKELKEGGDYHELDEIPFWSNERGFSNKKRLHLYRVNLNEEKIESLVGGYKNVTDFDISDDKISLVVNEYEDKMEPENYLYEFDLNVGELKKLTDRELRIERAHYFKEDILFQATDMERMGLNTNLDFYLYEQEENECKKITDIDKSLANSLLSDVRYGGGKVVRVEGDVYYFLITEEYNVGLYKFTFENGVEPVIRKQGSIDAFDVYEGEFVYVGFRDLRPQELYLYDENEKRLTDFNDMDFEFSKPEHFEVKSNDRTVDAWIMKPVDYEDDVEYPTILEIHGGPKCVYGTIHYNEMQLLANQGYAVIFSNPSGSSGKGNDFADIRGEHAGPDYDDIMNVVDEALEIYDFIDEDRLGVTGGSYGGYMTNWIIGHTDKFQAAVSFRSVSNRISSFATSDIGYYYLEDQLLANPWDDFKKLWDISPLKYADQVNTPTLLISAREDYRCWEAEAIQMFTSLKYHGVEAKLILFEGENHNLSREGKPKQRIKRLEKMLDWFDKQIKN